MSEALTVGTAGHVDHGKTTLVEALTGRDTDRLQEEKRRGISIELGFAELDLGSRRLSLIDVPGHERLVRTMIAGVTGIDLFLMAVAADDGVMPQTLEHATVLRALAIDLGAVALTKCDLVGEARRVDVARETRALFPEAPLVEIGGRDEKGLKRLRSAMSALASRADARLGDDLAGSRPVVLHVDRAFTVIGHGTVVTGTLWSGTVRREDRLEVQPQARSVRVRAIQVHDLWRESAGPRQRVALNVTGWKGAPIGRGDVIVGAGSDLRPSYRLDVELSTSASIGNHERVQVHHGTREVPARVVPFGTGEAQLRLEAPLIAAEGDRVVLRRIAPPDTLGGGIVRDPHPRRHGGKIEADTAAAEIGAGRSEPAVAQRGAPEPPATPHPLAERAFGVLCRDREMPRGSRALAQALDVEQSEAEAVLAYLVASKRLTQIKPDIHYPAAELERLIEEAVALARPEGSISVAELRDALGISRKYSQALLEQMDSRKLSIRRGDRHVLRPAQARA